MREPLGTSGFRGEQLESKCSVNQATGRKVRPITDVTRTALGKEEIKYSCRLFGMNSRKEGAVWHIDPFLGKDLETNNESTAVAEQQRGKHTSTTVELLLKMVLCSLLLGSCNS
jgi:hypothetical protein